MRHLATALFVIVGVINLLPVTGVLGAERLGALYGVAITGGDLLLLLRHRAVLLSMVGAFLLLAAFRDRWRAAATVAGLISMFSFILIAMPPQSHGAALQRVFWADVVACVLLLAAWTLSTRLRVAR